MGLTIQLVPLKPVGTEAPGLAVFKGLTGCLGVTFGQKPGLYKMVHIVVEGMGKTVTFLLSGL